MDQNFSKLEKTIGIKFKNRVLLQTAFVHRSFLNENPSCDLSSNERLEFLGDAVLEFLISEHLYKKYSAQSEGKLTAFRSALVCAKSLSKVSKDLLLGEYLFLSRGEEQTGGRARPYILANTFEALLGAIYLDQDIETARKFVKKIILPELTNIIKSQTYKDSKSKLQEITQEKVSITPTYQVIEERGPDHNKWFKIAVSLNDKEVGVGEGKSKQEAEQEAAKAALAKWENI